MNFGTLKSFIRERDKLDAPSDLDSEQPMDSMDADFPESDPAPEEETQSIVQKLLSIKSQIDDTLRQMGYESDYEFDFDLDTEDQDQDETDMDSLFNFDDVDGEAVDSEEYTNDIDDDMSAFDDKDDVNASGEDTDFDFTDNETDATGSDMVDQHDPNFEGEIRTVAGADLVYKRKQEDGNYEELWIYNVGNDIRKETEIRKAILAGTDIDPSQRESEDGLQNAETSTVGNVQYLKITGLPN